MEELSEFQKGITVGMDIKDASNREIGRQLEIEAERVENLGRSGRPTKINEATGNWVLELKEEDQYRYFEA